MARGNIRQRSKRRQDSWTIQVYLGKDGKSGKKRYYSEAVKGSKAVAERRLTEVLRELDQGVFVEPSGLTVGEFLDSWVEGECALRLRGDTLVGYRMVVRVYLKPLLGHIRLDELRGRDIVGMESYLLKEGNKRKGGGLSASTVGRVHRVLSSAMTGAVNAGVVRENIMNGVSMPKLTAVERPSFSWEQLGELLGVLEGDELHDVVIVAVQTGLRRSELGGLQWGDMDLDAGFLAVRRGLVLGMDGYELGAPKSGRGRPVLMPEATVGLMKRLKGRGEHVGPRDFVFCGADGTPVELNRWSKRFPVLCRANGFEGFRFHDLRHTHASLMMGVGVPLKVVSERLGHSSVKVTGDLYSHVVPSVQRDAADRFDMRWRAGVDGENEEKK